VPPMGLVIGQDVEGAARPIPRLCLTVAVAATLWISLALPSPVQAANDTRFTSSDVSSFVRQMAKTGIRTYRPGSRKPVVRVRGPVSPIRLTPALAKSAALGARTRTGMTAAQINTLTGRLNIGGVRVPTGALVVGWATAAKTRSARLARQLLGPVDRAHYETVVVPNAVLMLFASDTAVHLPRPGTKRRSGRSAGSAGVRAHAAAGGPCTATQEFIEDTVRRVLARIGHIKPDRDALNRIFGDVIGPALNAAGELLVIPVNAAIDAAGFIVINATRIPVRVVTEALAGVAGAVTVVSAIANGILPWSGRIFMAPNPIRKGVSMGTPGELTLAVTALRSNFQWPGWVQNCAELLRFPLPTTTPKNEPVNWNLVQQAPAGLVTPLSGDGRLDEKGEAKFGVVTAVEDPKTATGPERFGRVDVVATVQRTDLDRLVHKLSDSLLRTIPGDLRTMLDPPIRAVINPLLNSITNRILTVRNVSTPRYFTVIYHDPPDEPEPGPEPPVPPPGLVRVYLATVPGTPLVAQFTQASCAGGTGGTPFTMNARSGDARLHLSIGAWAGYGRTYTWSPGAADPVVTETGAAGRNWSTASILPPSLWMFIAPLVGNSQSVIAADSGLIDFKVQSLAAPPEPDQVIYIRGGLRCS
jgi:hypothetical protein